MATYSYDPSAVGELGVSRMRLELGDCLIDEPEKTAYLCDEEIAAVIESEKSWKAAKLRLVESLLWRFAYEVDERADPASWAWHQRFEQWKKLRDALKAEVEASKCSPLGLGSRPKRPPYFHEDMHANLARWN